MNFIRRIIEAAHAVLPFQPKSWSKLLIERRESKLREAREAERHILSQNFLRYMAEAEVQAIERWAMQNNIPLAQQPDYAPQEQQHHPV